MLFAYSSSSKNTTYRFKMLLKAIFVVFATNILFLFGGLHPLSPGSLCELMQSGKCWDILLLSDNPIWH